LWVDEWAGLFENESDEREDLVKPSRLKGGMRWLAASVAVVGLMTCAAVTLADEPRPEQMRDQMRKLEQKAKELQAAGQEDQANAVRHEMQELLEKMGRMDQERHAERARGDDRRVDLQKKLEHVRAELKEAREGGKEERVADLQRGVHAIEEQLARLNQPSGREHGPMPHAEQMPMEQRLQHIREAIGHLHAAGIHDLADNLAHEAEKMQQQMHNQPHERQGGGEVERLQAEIQELRQAVRQLNARLDGQKHEQR